MLSIVLEGEGKGPISFRGEAQGTQNEMGISLGQVIGKFFIKLDNE